MRPRLQEGRALGPHGLVDQDLDRSANSSRPFLGQQFSAIVIVVASGSWFRSVFTNVLAVLAPHAAIYCWHAHKRAGLLRMVWEELGIIDHQQVRRAVTLCAKREG